MDTAAVERDVGSAANDSVPSLLSVTRPSPAISLFEPGDSSPARLENVNPMVVKEVVS